MTVVVAAGDGEDAFTARLTSRGWLERYRDADGAVLVRSDRPVLALDRPREYRGAPDHRVAVPARDRLLESAA